MFVSFCRGSAQEPQALNIADDMIWNGIRTFGTPAGQPPVIVITGAQQPQEAEIMEEAHQCLNG
jgi:hypothetical protein